MRADVSAVLFDEPLTVIDPALKWELRSKLKAVHRALDLLMIYVTHDQTEALTFADKVVVMNDGRAVQIGTPAELFERPEHTFVGYFIGSPGMNLLPARVSRARAPVSTAAISTWRRLIPVLPQGRARAGRRAARIRRADLGPGLARAGAPRSPISAASASPMSISAAIRSSPPCRPTWPSVRRPRERRVRSRPYACLCRRRARAGSGGMTDKPINNRAWFFVLPVLAFVLFSSIIPMMTVVNYSVQDTMGENNFFWNGDRVVPRSPQPDDGRSARDSTTRCFARSPFPSSAW